MPGGVGLPGVLRGWIDMDEVPEMSVEELDALCVETLKELHGRIDDHDELFALRVDAADDSKKTDVHAIEALQRTERFRGEHAVAMAWLKTSKTARVWSSKGRG